VASGSCLVWDEDEDREQEHTYFLEFFLAPSSHFAASAASLAASASAAFLAAASALRAWPAAFLLLTSQPPFLPMVLRD